MPLSSLQAAVLAAVTSVIGLLVAFAVVSGETAQIVIGACATLVPAVFVIANAIIHHGVTAATKTDASKR